jgi:hypothetical protein
MSTFINHCGAEPVTLDQLRTLADPVPFTSTHYPIRHDHFIDEMKRAMIPSGFEITREEYSLRQDAEGDHGHDNMFGILEFQGTDDGIAHCAAVRNSGTQDFRAMLGCGGRVFVCDNLMFSAQIVVGRKHTRFIERDLPKLAGDAIRKMSLQFDYGDLRTKVYKESKLGQRSVNDLMIRTLNAGGIPASQVPAWIKECAKPAHEEFGRGDAWSLLNCHTEIAKRWNFDTMQTRTQIVQGIIDQGLNLHEQIKPLLENKYNAEEIAEAQIAVAA